MVEIKVGRDKNELPDMGSCRQLKVIFSHIPGGQTGREWLTKEFALTESINPGVGMNDFFVNAKERNESNNPL